MAREQAGMAMERAKEQAGMAMARAKEKTGELTERALERSRELKSQMGESIERNPSSWGPCPSPSARLSGFFSRAWPLLWWKRPPPDGEDGHQPGNGAGNQRFGARGAYGDNGNGKRRDGHHSLRTGDRRDRPVRRDERSEVPGRSVGGGDEETEWLNLFKESFSQMGIVVLLFGATLARPASIPPDRTGRVSGKRPSLRRRQWIRERSRPEPKRDSGNRPVFASGRRPMAWPGPGGLSPGPRFFSNTTVPRIHPGLGRA